MSRRIGSKSRHRWQPRRIVSPKQRDELQQLHGLRLVEEVESHWPLSACGGTRRVRGGPGGLQHIDGGPTFGPPDDGLPLIRTTRSSDISGKRIS